MLPLSSAPASTSDLKFLLLHPCHHHFMQVPEVLTAPLLHTTHNSAYVTTALKVLHEPQVEYAARLMARKVGRILAIDAGIKNTGKVINCVAVLETALNSWVLAAAGFQR